MKQNILVYLTQAISMPYMFLFGSLAQIMFGFLVVFLYIKKQTFLYVSPTVSFFHFTRTYVCATVRKLQVDVGSLLQPLLGLLFWDRLSQSHPELLKLKLLDLQAVAASMWYLPGF